MITIAAKGRDDDYVLGRTEREYERLRAQALVWDLVPGGPGIRRVNRPGFRGGSVIPRAVAPGC